MSVFNSKLDKAKEESCSQEKGILKKRERSGWEGTDDGENFGLGWRLEERKKVFEEQLTDM